MKAVTKDTEAVRALRQRLFSEFPAEAADELERLPLQEALELIASEPPSAGVRVWERLSPQPAAELLCKMPAPYATELLARMDVTRTARILSVLDENQREAWLGMLPPSAHANLRRLLSYPPDSAGSLMDPRFFVLRRDMTVREALDRLRKDGGEGRRILYTVDEESRVNGQVEVQDLALTVPNQSLETIVRPLQAYVEVTTPREELLEKIERRRLSSLPVVDLEGQLLGVVRHDALLEAAREDAAADLLTMVGASREERALSRASLAVRKRLPWLQINLLTAFLAAAVVGLFEDTIARYTALAVLLPVVAGQSGNTGAQAMAITMRGLALREIHLGHWPRILFKEFRVGACNGLAVALTTAAGVYVWSRSAGLMLVVGVSMVASMVIAGVAGATVPMVLTRLGQDPAQASSIILTTVTDIAGFFSFLGIATLLSSLL